MTSIHSEPPPMFCIKISTLWHYAQFRRKKIYTASVLQELERFTKIHRNLVPADDGETSCVNEGPSQLGQSPWLVGHGP